MILDVPSLAGHLELRLDPAKVKALRGYDFLTLAVADRSALDNWIARLDALGIHHSPPIVALLGWLLVAADPDGLRLRFYTTEPHRLDESAVEFDSPWLGTGPIADSADNDDRSIVCAIGSDIPGVPRGWSAGSAPARRVRRRARCEKWVCQSIRWAATVWYSTQSVAARHTAG